LLWQCVTGGGIETMEVSWEQLLWQCVTGGVIETMEVSWEQLIATVANYLIISLHIIINN